MTGAEIVKKARTYSCYKYWYGGKRQIATVELANELKKENPSVWTDDYYQTALKDVDGKTRVCDCSGLVCACYGITDIGSYQIKDKFKTWNGKPKPGMIAYKPGHVAIISDTDGHVIEMRSQAYDYCDYRYRKEAGLMTLLYDESVDYDESETEEYEEDTTDPGWYSDENGWYYRHTKGTGPETYYHDCFQVVDGHTYVFDSSGYICYFFRVRPSDFEGWVV